MTSSLAADGQLKPYTYAPGFIRVIAHFEVYSHEAPRLSLRSLLSAT